MASSVIAYSCYLSSNNQQFQENYVESESSSGFKMFHFLVQEYAQMLIEGADSEAVYVLIQKKQQ